MSPTTPTFLFLVWGKVDVRSARDSRCLESDSIPDDPSKVHREPANGLESCLVRSDDLNVYQYPVRLLGMVSAEEENQTFSNLGVYRIVDPNGD